MTKQTRIKMPHTAKNPQARFTAWNHVFRLLTLVILTNVTAFLLYCFTSYKSAFRWVYGDSIWVGFGVQLILTALLSVAFRSAHHYYAMAQAREIEGERNTTECM
jgi:hypothetical protein